jgi:hypothetical protein
MLTIRNEVILSDVGNEWRPEKSSEGGKRILRTDIQNLKPALQWIFLL